MKSKLIAALFAGSALFAFTSAVASDPNETWDGSEATAVHRLPLFNEYAEQIVPSYEGSMPFSTQFTCGSCHDYSTVRQGWHFNSSKEIADPGRPGEPWVLVDEPTGTQLPLSYRGWPGTWNPAEIGMSEWDFTLRFGRHMPGGDTGEPENEFADPHARWDLSGKLEINCIACHDASHHIDMSEWSRQIARENLRWATTASSGLGEVGGMASRMDDAWLPVDGPNPDDTEFAVAPNVDYKQSQFDSKDRAFFDVTARPPDSNCLYCHSATPADQAHWQSDGDVHARSGLQCIDCHRNDLSHAIIRGYEGERLAFESGSTLNPDKQTLVRNYVANVNTPEAPAHEFSCRGCHVGTPDSTASAGRLGAPIAEHRGIPSVHFEKLACTTCHSAPVDESGPQVIRTSRANRLGVHGRAQWHTESPRIVQPVYAQDQTGKVAPHRAMWPAFWARMKGDAVEPVLPGDIEEVASDFLSAQHHVAKVLVALAPTAENAVPAAIISNDVLIARSDGFLQRHDSIASPTSGLELVLIRDSAIVPLVPLFDPTPDLIDWQAEERLLRVLELLEPITPAEMQPAVHVQGFLFTRSFEGLLEKNSAATVAPRPSVLLVDSGEMTPLVDPLLVESVEKTFEGDAHLTEEQVAHVLARLSERNKGTSFAYIASGKLHRLARDGSLVWEDHAAAEPVLWPYGHNVLPAAQSVGVKSCAECHSGDAAFFFAPVAAVGPMLTDTGAVTAMHAFADYDEGFHRLFGKSFQVREIFKKALIVCSFLIGAVFLLFLLFTIRRVIAFAGGKR